MPKKIIPPVEITNEEMVVDGDFFKGNENLLRGNATLKWTKEMEEDLKLCRKSILHFAESHFYIVTLDEGKRKIELYKFQKRLLKSFKSNRFNIVCASRQVGKSTCITMYALWLVCFFDDKRITIVANKADTAEEIFGRIRMAFEGLPLYLKTYVKSWRKN
jgi:phage terminase large subunit-like protein